ncbi:hypothetical protein VPH35_053941 [Triticum aestivum]
MRMAIQASAVSRQWRHLLHQRSRLLMNVGDFRNSKRTVDQVMATYTDATLKLLSPLTCKCRRTIKTLQLSFYLTEPYISSIGHAVGDVVKSGITEHLEFAIYAEVDNPSDAQLVLFGQRFMSFFHASLGPFKLLTKLTLKDLDTCNKLKLLSLKACGLGPDSILRIDAPCSELQALELICFGCIRVELICLPKLWRVVYDTWYGETPPCVFWLRTSASTPKLCLSCSGWAGTIHVKRIWVKPENPEQLSPIFGKLRDVDLCNIFAECDLSWILFILEAAPSLEKFYSSRHPCELNKSEDSAERTNLVWQTSNFKHLNLKLLVIQGFEEEDMVMNYIRLVMERAVGLKRIELHDKRQCSKCNALNLGSKFPSDEASKEWIRQQLTYSFSSSIEIVFKE